uniref:GCG_CRPN prefix-to-repeats domain-containing protein n=1 Tax=Bradyrhizobium sp. (strain ORS 278) TaxID=114615 RepID=UPI0035272C10
MPLAVIDTGSSAHIIQVAGGCGRGFHRGPFGGCRRNWANPAAHACPRGYHIGPGGGCRGNGK